MKQGQYSPLAIGEMAFSLFAANEGFLDDVEEEKIVSFEKALLDYVRSSQKPLLDKINESGDYDSEIESAMRKALEEFKAKHSW